MDITETFRKDHSKLPKPVSRNRLLLLGDVLREYWDAHPGDPDWLRAQYAAHRFTAAEFRAYWGWSLELKEKGEPVVSRRRASILRRRCRSNRRTG